MKKYTNKNQVKRRWQSKINEAREYFTEEGGTRSEFYESDVYRELNRRRNRAVYRYENREKISKQRKKLRKKYKKQEVVKEGVLPTKNPSYEGAAVTAFKGRKIQGDYNYCKLLIENGANFLGELTVNEDGLVVEYIESRQLNKFFNLLSFYISSLFRKAEGYKILNSNIVKRLYFDKGVNTVFL